MWIQIAQLAVLAALAAGVWLAVVLERSRERRMAAMIDEVFHRGLRDLWQALDRGGQVLSGALSAGLSRPALTEERREGYARDTYYGYPLDEMVRQSEVRSGIHLTRAARQLLLVPIIESLEQGEDVGFSQMSESIEAVVTTAAREPSPDDAHDTSRHAKSIIRAFHRRFCNIPPFCSRREEERET